MATEGPISLRARGYIPKTWDALATSTFYGETLLDQKAEFVKFMTFATVVDASLESTVYNPLVQEYTAKLLVLSVIPSGADYWADTLQSVVATGTSENRSYPDRVSSLWRIHARLLAEATALLPQVQSYLPSAGFRSKHGLPKRSSAGVPYLSGDPARFWVLGATNRTQDLGGNLPWGPAS